MILHKYELLYNAVFVTLKVYDRKKRGDKKEINSHIATRYLIHVKNVSKPVYTACLLKRIMSTFLGKDIIDS